MKNGVMLQFFEWNLPNEGNLWRKLKEEAVHLHKAGITSIWIPPAYKADEQQDEGYAVYDLFDLGEFHQKNTIRTKYGTKQELIEAINELHKYRISVYLDAVMNHKAGGEYTERFMAQEVDPEERRVNIGAPHEIENFTGYDFPGRDNRYSTFKWHWYHFSGTGYDDLTKKQGIYRITGENKNWSEGVDTENGNYDYLLCNDIDLNHPKVIQELNHWGEWIANELDLDGIRLDAIKHMEKKFVKQFLQYIRKSRGKNFFAVGEYWHRYYKALEVYLEFMEYSLSLFDVPLHYKFHYASKQGKNYHLNNFLEETLSYNLPENAVTFVENHDTQKGSSLESEVESWFKPIAYGIILLMEKGYPCIFYGDYYDIGGKLSPYKEIINLLLDIRRKYAYGKQYNYFNEPHIAGFSRTGDDAYQNSGLAYIFSNNQEGKIEMYVGENHAGEIWHDISGNIQQEIIINEYGKAIFSVKRCQSSIWIKKEELIK